VNARTHGGQHTIYDQLPRVRHGGLATLRGKLVHVRDAGGSTADTSVTASDRDCEMMWLEELRIARM
jgi:hypothetical protein